MRLRRMIKYEGINSCLKLGLGFRSAFLHSYKLTSKDLKDLFNLMIHSRPLPSVSMFTQLLHDLTIIKQYSCALDFFKQMFAIGVPINKYTANILINSYFELHQTDKSFPVLGCCFKQGIEPSHVSTYNTILEGFIRENKTHEAEFLFNKLFIQQKQLLPDLVTYNTMIKGFCKIGHNFTAIALLRLMPHHGNLITYNTIIYSLCKDVINVNDAFKLLKQMKSIPIPPNIFTYNSFLYALSKLGRWNHVSRILKQMQDENISPQLETFDIIWDALFKQGKRNETNLVFNIMYAKYPTSDLFSNKKHVYEDSLRLHRFKDASSNKNINSVIDAYNILIDRAIKCGNFDEARRLFHDVFVKGVLYNVETYSLMIHAFSRGGGGLLKVATKLFHKMDNSYLQPNAIIVNDLVQGHLKFTPFHNASLLSQELMKCGYISSTATASLFIEQIIAKQKNERVRDVLRKVIAELPEICTDVLDPSMTYKGHMLELQHIYRPIKRNRVRPEA